MVNVNANYKSYVEFYDRHKKEYEAGIEVKTEKDTVLKIDATQIFNLMKQEGANAVLVVLEQLKAQGVNVTGPEINLSDGTVNFKLGNVSYTLHMAEDENISDKPADATDNIAMVPIADKPKDTTDKTTTINNSSKTTTSSKATAQNLMDMYDFYSSIMQKVEYFENISHGVVYIDKLQNELNENLQEYINTNKLDISLENLKAFFDDVQKNVPSYNKDTYLEERFNDYIKNNYTVGLATSPSSTTSTTVEKQEDKPTITATTNAIDYSFVLRKITYVSGHLPDSAKGKSFDPTISAYNGDNNVIGENSDGDKIFNDLLNDIKNAILDVKGENYIKDTIGEANFEALFKSAWVRTVESMNKVPVNSDEFAKNALTKLEEIFKNIQAHPENLTLFTDTSVNIQDLVGYNGTSVNSRNYKQYDTKEYHLDDDNSDKQFQQTMQELLNRIYDKYPNVDKSVLKDLFNNAQGEALNAVNSNGTLPFTHQQIGNVNSARMDTLVDIVTYKFHNLLAEQVLNDGTLKARTETKTESNPTPKSTQTDAQNESYKTGASGVKEFINKSYVKNQVVTNCKTANKQNADFHTEFGIDSNGNIVFQESSTTEVYKQLKETIKGLIDISISSDTLNKLDEANFDKLVQAAWIMTYNDFNSSTSNNLEKFINTVIDNLTKMLDKITSNPELMEAYTKHTSYADSTLTKDLKHYGTNTTYGGDEKIYYKGAVTVHDDETVHISSTNDDNDYQTTMNALLERVIAKYSSVDSKVITSVFRNAQKSAIEAAQKDFRDCPYGTNSSSARVEDTTKNFYLDGSKKNPDSRKGDNWYIDMDQLVQFTLYYFDKLLLKELTK